MKILKAKYDAEVNAKGKTEKHVSLLKQKITRLEEEKHQLQQKVNSKDEEKAKTLALESFADSENDEESKRFADSENDKLP